MSKPQEGDVTYGSQIDSIITSITQEEKSNFIKRNANIKSGIMISIFLFGLYFLFDGIITSIPHKTRSDKNIEEKINSGEVVKIEEIVTKDTYLFEHEYQGDRYLRATTGKLLLSCGILIMILLISFGFAFDKDNSVDNFLKIKIYKDKFKNIPGKNYKHYGYLSSKYIFYVLLVAIFGILIYFLIYSTGRLNGPENKKRDKDRIEERCKGDGINLHYETCSNNEILKMFNQIIEPKRKPLIQQCRIDIEKYKTVRQFELQNPVQDINNKLQQEQLNPEVYQEYKENNNEFVVYCANLDIDKIQEFEAIQGRQILPDDDNFPTQRTGDGEQSNRCQNNLYEYLIPVTCDKMANIQLEKYHENTVLRANILALKNYQETDHHARCMKVAEKKQSDANHFFNALGGFDKLVRQVVSGDDNKITKAMDIYNILENKILGVIPNQQIIPEGKQFYTDTSTADIPIDDRYYGFTSYLTCKQKDLFKLRAKNIREEQILQQIRENLPEPSNGLENDQSR